MPAKKKTVQLPWDKTNRRFSKMHGGRRWKSARGLDPKNPNHYRAALAEFLAFCDDRTLLPLEHEKAIKIRNQMIRWYERFEQNQAALDMLKEEITDIAKMAKKGERLSNFKRSPMQAMSTEGRAVWQERLVLLERTENAELELLTYKVAFDEFREFKAGTVSDGQQSVLSAHIGFFMRCVGDHQPLKSLCITHWESFWNKLQQNLKSDKWSKKYGNSVLASVRGFLRWCYDTERLEILPRFVTSNLYSIEVPTTKPIPFTKKEVLSILSVATDEQRLLYLMMLNCAMTQKGCVRSSSR